MHRRQRSVMARVHRLQHVQRLAAAAFADDDAVRTHSETVLHEVADRYRTLPLDVRGTGLEPHDMRLLQPKFRRVLDRHDTLVLGNVAGQEVEERRLAGSRAAGDDDVLAEPHAQLHELRRIGRPRAEADKVLRRQRLLRKLSNRDRRPAERERRNDRIDTAAVRQARVHIRLRLVDAAPKRRHNALDHGHDARIVRELAVGEHQLSAALDVDLLRTVHHDFRDRFVRQQFLQRSEAHRLVEDVLLQTIRINPRRQLSVRNNLVDDAADLLPCRILQPLAVNALHGEPLHVHSLQEFLLNLRLDAAAKFAERIGISRSRSRQLYGGLFFFLLFDNDFRLRLLFFRLAHPQHAAADLHNHAAVKNDGTVNCVAVHQRAVGAVQVFKDRLVVPHGENRMALAHLGQVEADAARLAAPDQIGARSQFARLALSVDECRENHVSGWCTSAAGASRSARRSRRRSCRS